MACLFCAFGEAASGFGSRRMVGLRRLLIEYLQHISARGQENLIALTVSKQAGPQPSNSKMHEAAQQIDKHNQKYDGEQRVPAT